jgi:5-methylthioribose kinase
MRLLDASTAEDYLRQSSRLARQERVRVRELTGGVSNMVLLVERPERPGDDFVLKQARAQLRTPHAWFSSVERIWREADVLSICNRLLNEQADKDNDAAGECPALAFGTPQILFEDRPNYLFAMSAAPRPHTVWKNDLLAGRIDPRVATACGRLLGTLHAASWLNDEIARALGDRTLFEELRIDPYYRTLAQCHADARAAIDRLIASLDGHPRALVLADFSPKNLLVSAGGLTLVDFETGHYGDPAFDLGFFLSHLVLKACLKAPSHGAYLKLTEQFQTSYDRILSAKIPSEEMSNLWARGVQNFAGCAWARLDGKSRVEYLIDVRHTAAIRALCRDVFEQEPATWPEVLALAARRFA